MGQNPNSSQNGNLSTRLLTGLVLVLGVVCLGLWGVALSRAGFLFGASPTDTPIFVNNKLTCQELINQAMRVSGNNCDHLGPNQVCYGNVTIHADLFPDVTERFTTTGDVIDVNHVQSLTTSPLNLEKKEWGIAIFNLIANLPRSVPGEAVKMVVFGNTTLGNNSETKGIQSFYFSSNLGQIVCEKVPFDGIMVTMPDGTGLKLSVNGSELTLMGNASLKAVKNGNMEVSMLSGLGSITSDGQTQAFGAGQKVNVPLGGANGSEVIGPPSQPTALSPAELTLACTLSGIDCLANPIPTMDPLLIQATLNAISSGTPATVGTSAIVPPPGSTSVPQQPPPSQNTPEPPPAATKIPPGLLKKTPTASP